MKLNVFRHNEFESWISERSNNGQSVWDTQEYTQHMAARNDWYEELRIKEDEQLFTPFRKHLELRKDSELINGEIKAGAYVYSLHKLDGGWNFLDAGLSAKTLNLQDGDFILVDFHFRPTGRVIVTPTPIYLPDNFSNYILSYYSSFRTPNVSICYTVESPEIGLALRAQPEPLKWLKSAGFSVRINEVYDQKLRIKHPSVPSDTLQRILFDAMGWFNVFPFYRAEYCLQYPQLQQVFDSGFSAFLKVGYSNNRREDPNTYVYIKLDENYENTFIRLAKCLEESKMSEEFQREKLRNEILSKTPVMKLERTSSYQEMLDQIYRQKAQGFVSADDAYRLSEQLVDEMLRSVNRAELFYAHCLREFGENALLIAD